MPRLADKVALITGASGGIGRAITALFAAEGAEVVASDLAAPEDENAALCLALDVTDEDDWARALAAVVERFGRLDVLVNNAGLALAKDLEETSLSEWRRVTAVNLDGVFLGTKAAIGTMRETGGGAIVNLSSVAGLIGAPMLAAYAAAKGGVRQFTKTAALHCAERRYGIRVNSLHPGFADTAMLDEIARRRRGRLHDRRRAGPRRRLHRAVKAGGIRRQSHHRDTEIRMRSATMARLRTCKREPRAGPLEHTMAPRAPVVATAVVRKACLGQLAFHRAGRWIAMP
jgi:NAD(P)-dependent dehydrogenase (short-subunit alcohol dehydrogenase family)